MQTTHPSFVHNEETGISEPQFSDYGLFLRQSDQAEWDAAWSVYDHLDRSESRSKADQLEHCRSNAWFARHVDTGEVRIASNACHLRWCPVCANARRNFIGYEVAEWLKTLKYPKLMTLTLKHSDDPLFHQVLNLYTYFTRLRKRKEFCEKVLGGVWFFQVKLSKSSKQWHPHIHCVIDGQYLPKSLLRRLWVQITDVSMIVDIRSVKDPDGCALEVARYAAKPGPLKDLDLNHAVELVSVMHGRKICGTWGIGKSVSLRPKKFTEKDKWQSVGSWSKVMSNRKTNSTCMLIFDAWQKHEPLDSYVSCYSQECRDRGQHVLILNDSNLLDEIFNTDWNPP